MTLVDEAAPPTAAEFPFKLTYMFYMYMYSSATIIAFPLGRLRLWASYGRKITEELEQTGEPNK